jgi:NAD-reducing hydrogenase large subunit
MAEPRLIEISPLTRVEGHGKVTIHLDADGQVDEARLHIVEFRGFERFIRGRLMWEVPVIVQRLCGICPVSHHLAAAKAMDQIAGVDLLPPTAEKMRQADALRTDHAEPCAALLPPCRAGSSVRLRRTGREAQHLRGAEGKPRAGPARHPDAQVRPGHHRGDGRQEDPRHGGDPGRHQLQPADRDARRLPRRSAEMEAWALDALALARDYTLEHAELVHELRVLPVALLSIVREGDGALDLYNGNCGPSTPDGVSSTSFPSSATATSWSRTCGPGPT